MTIPEHLIDTVYLGDVFELMRQLPDKSVDMVFSDPDYNVGVRYNGKSYTRSFEEYIEWYIELARESLRVLKDDGNMFFINYPKQNAYLRVRFLDEACYECKTMCRSTIRMWGTARNGSPLPTAVSCTAARPRTTIQGAGRPAVPEPDRQAHSSAHSTGA